MEPALDLLGQALPEALKQQLQHAINSLPEPAREALRFLPEETQRVLETPEGLFVALLTVLFGLLALLLLLRRAGSSTGGSKGSTVVLAGPVNTGKTTLFFRLTDGGPPSGTVASMQENSGSCAVTSKGGRTVSVRVVDVPGHASLRHRLEAQLRDAAVIVVLVDAVEVTPHRLEAAELLFEVLAHPAVQRRRLPILIACNKVDLEMEAHSVEFIRKTLEKQLETMRRTRSAGIGKEAGGTGGLPAPPEGKAFSLAGLPRNKVALLEVSARTGQGVDEVQHFIASNC